MKPQAKRHPRNPWAWRFAKIAASSAALLVSGCPVAVETEPPANLAGSGGNGSAGATSAGSAGVAGGAGSAGAAAGSATAGGAGAAGATAMPITPPAVDCAIEAVLVDHCGPGCHSSSVRRAGLDLTYDSGLVGRIKDVPATHRGIACNQPSEAFRECVPPNEPTRCAPFLNAQLVDSANVEESWILKKVNGTHGDCGMKMPAVPTGYGGWVHDCLQEFVRAVAALPR